MWIRICGVDPHPPQRLFLGCGIYRHEIGAFPFLGVRVQGRDGSRHLRRPLGVGLRTPGEIAVDELPNAGHLARIDDCGDGTVRLALVIAERRIGIIVALGRFSAVSVVLASVPGERGRAAGDTVYAMQHRQFEVVDAFPDRTYYRYVFRGEWVLYLGLPVEPRLQPVSVAEGETVRTDVSASVPDQAALVSIRLTSEGENDYATVTGADRLDLQLSTDRERMRLTGDGIDEQVSVPTPENGTVTLVMFVDYGTGAGFEYRAEIPVDRTAESVRTLTPRLEVCRDQRRCGGEAAYVPGTHREGISINATTTAETT